MLDPMIDWHINVLARTIYGMANAQDAQTREALVALIMNRCAAAMRFDTRKRWGLTIADVCLKPGEFYCWDADRPERVAAILAAPGDFAFMECFLLATRAAHGFYKDETGGADTFCEADTDPELEVPTVKTTTIGPWDFYRQMPKAANAA